MIFILMLMLFQPSLANANVIVDDEALIYMSATIKYEQEYQIEKYLLAAISTVETGRWNAELRHRAAWPWTINARGRGYYYKTKEEAIEAVEALRELGVESIDVGCMQVNLSFHGHAFASLEDAFDPEKNVEYAASHLAKLYSRRQDWMKAATDYHSKTPSKARRYERKLVSVFEEVMYMQNRFEKKYAQTLIAWELEEQNRGWFSRVWGGTTPAKPMKDLKLSFRG